MSGGAGAVDAGAVCRGGRPPSRRAWNGAWNGARAVC
ncbi:hypothetical protein SAMN05216505_101524 [Streptomyces prasinopilosus]|uniref:Uncharacterized protein n=1 Tax=Streptomyces prasinopilosus TaxID=67344 RepID=A0A1G6J4Q6_9ACTN|nr:hypothetical protein SAMN05216505_101524 [Streptomyces prasinopilosus]